MRFFTLAPGCSINRVVLLSSFYKSGVQASLAVLVRLRHFLLYITPVFLLLLPVSFLCVQQSFVLSLYTVCKLQWFMRSVCLCVKLEICNVALSLQNHTLPPDPVCWLSSSSYCVKSLFKDPHNITTCS